MGNSVFDNLKESTIRHAGVKGMKWGIRKSVENRLASIKSGMKKVGSSSQTTADPSGVRKIKSGKMKKIKAASSEREKNWEKIYLGRSALTNAEMTKALNRMNLENQFAQQVNAAKQLNPTPAKKSLYENMTGAVVTGSKYGSIIYDALPSDYKKNQKVKTAGSAAKAIAKLTSVK